MFSWKHREHGEEEGVADLVYTNEYNIKGINITERSALGISEPFMYHPASDRFWP
jgi:hypothetical protein